MNKFELNLTIQEIINIKYVEVLMDKSASDFKNLLDDLEESRFGGYKLNNQQMEEAAEEFYQTNKMTTIYYSRSFNYYYY